MNKLKPSFFVTLKFDTLICYANDSLMLSGKSVIIFNVDRLRKSNDDVIKMANIYGYG